jgi:hypothetical protein
MFIDAYELVNESGANSSLAPVVAPQIEQDALAVPVPGEDGEPQSVSGPAFDTVFSLIALGALMVLAVQVAQL